MFLSFLTIVMIYKSINTTHQSQFHRNLFLTHFVSFIIYCLELGKLQWEKSDGTLPPETKSSVSMMKMKPNKANESYESNWKYESLSY